MGMMSLECGSKIDKFEIRRGSLVYEQEAMRKRSCQSEISHQAFHQVIKNPGPVTARRMDMQNEPADKFPSPVLKDGAAAKFVDARPVRNTAVLLHR